MKWDENYVTTKTAATKENRENDKEQLQRVVAVET